MDIYEKLTPILRDIFDNDEIVATSDLRADDVEEWDSLSHIRLIVALEQEFDIRFAVTEVTDLKDLGELVAVIQGKID